MGVRSRVRSSLRYLVTVPKAAIVRWLARSLPRGQRRAARRAKQSKLASLTPRGLRAEPLEVRQMLSVSPPVIACVGNQLAPGATSVQYSITFNESVTGLDLTDISVAGQNASGTVASLTGSGASYTVTVNSLSGNGLLPIVVTPTDPITDSSSNTLAGPVTSEAFALSSSLYLDTTATGGSTWNATNANWRVGGTSGPLSTWIANADAVFPSGTSTVTVSGNLNTAHSVNSSMAAGQRSRERRRATRSA